MIFLEIYDLLLKFSFDIILQNKLVFYVIYNVYYVKKKWLIKN